MIEPIPGEPAAIAELQTHDALLIADYHAGIEVGIRSEGVELTTQAPSRRDALLELIQSYQVKEVILLGDVGDSIAEPSGEERAEIVDLLEHLTVDVAVTITKGNHDGRIESITTDFDRVQVVDGPGFSRDDIGFCHGHTWPAEEVVAASTLCTAHEHPLIRLEDDVGGFRYERVWVRGTLDQTGFPDYEKVGNEIVIFPTFNSLSGGTVVNDADDFLSPFLPDGISNPTVYLLDGTRLGTLSAL